MDCLAVNPVLGEERQATGDLNYCMVTVNETVDRLHDQSPPASAL
jgi:hypothetical protein